MIQISTLNNAPKQNFQYNLEGYDTIDFTLEFKPQQESWFISITYGTWSLMNERVATSLNMLRQFKNILPFGLLIYTTLKVDPCTIDAWEKGWEFYILTRDEVAQIEADYYVN